MGGKESIGEEEEMGANLFLVLPTFFV